MPTLSALDLRFATNAPDPLIAAHGRIARLTAVRVLPSARKYLFPSPEQAPKERDLVDGRRGHRHVCRALIRFGHLLDLRVFQRAQPFGDIRAFKIERGQTALQGRNLSRDVICTSDDMTPYRRETSFRKPLRHWSQHRTAHGTRDRHINLPRIGVMIDDLC